MSDAIPGLHHVTAICGAPQANLDFYAGPLGQRLVKRTVNFDDPGTYHLYYGDPDAQPGSILTFFPFENSGTGRAGPGMASAFAYGVADLDATMAELEKDAVAFEGPFERFGERAVAVADPDGLRIELIETSGADGGFHSVTLWQRELAPTRSVLELFGYERVGDEDVATGGTGRTEHRVRWRSREAGRGPLVDLIVSDTASAGRSGAGTIHHVAFRAYTREEHVAWRERLAAAGYDVTPVIDRQYFDAIYFREPGGVLFEIATDPPGFTVDEDEAHLGEALKLPAQYEQYRDRIEQTLPPLTLPA